jgi:putative FmdB family regulatory protein
MPTYENSCKACGHDFERFESITAAPDKSCPKCKKKKAERRISGGGGFLFKGTGFYITDYKKSPAGGGGDSGKPAAAHSCDGSCSHGGSDKKTDSKTAESKPAESKPAAKSESKSTKTSAA